MNAQHASDGTVTIEFNSQAEMIVAGFFEDGQPSHKYLPCDGECGRLLTVGLNVVSHLCSKCKRADDAAGSVWEQVIFHYDENGLNAPPSEIVDAFEATPADSTVGDSIINAYDAIAPLIQGDNFADVREELMRDVEHQSMIFMRA